MQKQPETPFRKMRREAMALAKEYESMAGAQVALADLICDIAKAYALTSNAT